MTTEEPSVITAALQRFGLERDRLRAALASQGGISPADLDALEHLEADGPLTQRELGERLWLTSGAVTMLVDRLERGGWVRRRPHPARSAVPDPQGGLLEAHDQGPPHGGHRGRH